MATRTVTVRLRADINQYTRSMRQAADNTSRMAGIGAKVGTALVAGFAIAAASAAKFDKALSNVRAVTGANTAQMKELRTAALEAAKTTQYTATQAADAEAELARAGVSVADITGGALKGSLALAASGQMDLADSAVIAAQAMNTFGLHGKDVTHIADVLSSAANKSAADMHGLGMSLRMGGLLANQTGLSLEDTVGTLAAFADHALIGSDAGTSLKVMLQRLVPQSDEAQAAMDKIGFSAYDAQGNFVGLSQLAGRMKTSFSKLTPEARNSAMATIFGADAVRSATILYELGSKGIDKYTKAVNDQGAAGRMAAIQTDNLVGDLERLRSAIEVALIEGGSAANGSLRQMTQWITGLVNAYNELPPGLQRTVTVMTGFAGAAALAGSAVLLLIPRIAATRAALASMGVTAARVRTTMLGLGRLSIVVAGLAAVSYGTKALDNALAGAPPNVTKMSNSLLTLAKTGKTSGELTKQFGKDLDGFGDAVARIAHPGVLDRVGDTLHTITHLGSDGPDLEKARKKIKSVDEALAALVQGGAPDTAAAAFKRMAKEAEAQGTSTEKLRTLLPGYADALTETDTQSQLSAESQAKLGEQMGLTADEMQDQRSEAEKLTDSLNELNGVAISAAEKEISFRQSLADLTDAVKENGRSLDVTTEKGRKVKSAFLDAAQAAMDHAQAVAEQKNSQEAGQKVLERDVGLLQKQMRAAHFSEDAIRELTGAYLKLPGVVTTKVDAKTASAITDLQKVQDKVASTKGKKLVMDAPTDKARAELEALGFKIKNTKGKKVEITVPTGSQRAAVDALAAAIRRLSGKTIRILTIREERAIKSTVRRPSSGEGGVSKYARGGIRFFAGGAENHLAEIARAGEWRVWAEDETGGEAYIPLAPSKRARSRKIAAETVKRLGGNVNWFASGGGFTYTPTGMPVLGGTTDAKQRYDQEIQDLKDAWKDFNAAVKEQKKATSALSSAEKNLAKVRRGHHTAAQLRAAQEKVDDAKKDKKSADAKVKKERADLNAADKELGLKKGAKTPTSFNLTAYVTQLDESVAATEKWRKNLAKIGKRGGAEVQALLQEMGEDGYALVNALAGASDKQFKSIVAKLQKTGDLAKATLADFTKQLTANTKESQQFAKDLQILASRGFGDLAQALAAQGDSTAMTLAHQAATGSAKDVGAANSAVSKAQSALSGEDLGNALVLLTTLRGGTGRGYADLIAAGLDTATIRALVPKMLGQINALPDPYKAKFLQQWAGQSGVAMARGGILSRPAVVLGGEAGVPESWIPHDGTARSRRLLSATAAAMGYQLTPASRYASAGRSASAPAQEVHKHYEVTLNGARQSTAEQAMDVARHMSLLG
ncbi:phage tail tape measure protein [Streptomyces sp. ME02-6978a]|uniref:phage tail tape measure protein n=1 Tax=unclassified Streptomyces TaxID=2593676 RepID=UPI0029AC8C7B|nr:MULTISPECIES: phage tail tape measure protein [unclassified Streptomyces]MDX3087195.1 phage tail tape measure protein [Streptomyces sp. ME12-02E]MDX3335837.1 phage tail tape measure protein [Streptomyces sp. ME02-6978a]